MCQDCSLFSRRKFVGLAAAGGVMLAGGFDSRAIAATSAATSLSAEDALAKLQAGNRRFVEAPQLCVSDMLNTRASVAKGQSPWATILACSDSRVAPELIFGGVGLGELFVARNAGNVPDTAVMGTIEYGAQQLGSPLVVVLGHKRCGAVAAACDVVTKKVKLPGSIGLMVAPITPAARAVRGKPGDFVDNAVIENAKRGAAAIVKGSAIVRERMHAGKLKVVYAHYDLDSGTVDFLG